MAGFWTVNEQAAQIILVTIVSICYMCGLGLDQTSCAFIGFQIGSGNVKKAKKYYKLLFIFSIWIVVIQASALYMFQNWVITVVTSNTNL